VLILGDSYSEDLVNMIFENNLLPDADIRVRYIPARCQIYRESEDISVFIAETNRALCAKAVPAFYAGLQTFVEKADIVIFAASWKEWSAERLPATLRNFGIQPETRVVVVGRKNFGDVQRKRYLDWSLAEKLALRNEVSADHLKINTLMQQNLQGAGVEFIDLHTLVCGENATACPVFTPEGKLISYDGGHLTQAGATWIGSLLKGHSVFANSAPTP
jgi:hypothetical protein